MSQWVKQERDKGANFPETDLILFLPLFVVYMVFRETAYEKLSYHGKIHVSKKLFIIEVILCVLFVYFYFFVYHNWSKILGQCRYTGKALKNFVAKCSG